MKGLTLPSSHCTSNRSPASSSITHPFVNANCGSRSQTYRLPEKSFSPSMPPTRSPVLSNSPVLMNCGANVFDDWLLLRFEIDLCLVALGGAIVDPLRGENDWLRLWPPELKPPVGEVMTADLGRSLEVVGTGDGEGEPRLKGLLRHFAPPAAEIDMLDCLSRRTWRNPKGKILVSENY